MHSGRTYRTVLVLPAAVAVLLLASCGEDSASRTCTTSATQVEAPPQIEFPDFDTYVEIELSSEVTGDDLDDLDEALLPTVFGSGGQLQPTTDFRALVAMWREAPSGQTVNELSQRASASDVVEEVRQVRCR